MNVALFDDFKRSFKRFAKKFNSLTAELEMLIESLEANPAQGISLGNGLYKIRLASESKGKGKSGGFRVITYYVQENTKTVYLVDIYDKSEESNIQKNELLKTVNRFFLNT